MVKARTKVLVDELGNRCVVPSFIIWEGENEEDSPSATTVILGIMEMCTILGLKTEEEWLDIDTDHFPHFQTLMLSRKFEHGAATVFLIGGPEFDKAIADQGVTLPPTVSQ